ncbi:ABC transporter permease subunit [Marinovum sp. 2_MG-2023]|uniref:amino acid ABC transporter permease n=1 Tax=unclassified Marinovum TaxID=2647166 RepID=UPI0026E24B00|nr:MULTISPECIES: ABC transporter permease subunit [unclassified Marinovum]MDO6728500.1 ABC transporter permease subunit [Marinovum sp. 2_MG-2023]MDO6778084.1 ABC transporter permease subunit [Marinovum sp. 1_MG-2023]
MSSLSDPPAESFRLSQLINDTRYRSITFQFIALILLIVAMAYLGLNLVQNLTAAGLNISYGFLGEPSGYDINQTLVEYTSQSTHWRAAVVGVLNTLLVAVLGCIMATIIGVFVGVLRLSNNWLVRKLMSIYVEIFRNVPVLIWILIIFFVMTASMPGPRSFRGEDASASMVLDSIAFTSQGVFTPGVVGGFGAGLLLLVVIASIIGVVAYGRHVKKKLFDEGKVLPGWPRFVILFAPALLVYAAISVTVGASKHNLVVATDLVQPGVSLSAFSDAAIEGKFRPVYCLVEGATESATAKAAWLNTSAMDMRNPGGLKMKTEYFASQDAAKAGFDAGECNMISLPAGDATAAAAASDTPAVALSDQIRNGAPLALDQTYLGNFRFTDGITVRGSLIALWFALSIYTAAFIAENVRAGILAVSKGQTEAAASLGLRPGRIMNLVVLPQALRVIIPPLISQYLNLTKNSSLAIAVGYMDLTGTLGGITLNQTGRAIECVLLLMLFYLTISLAISALMNVYNNAVKLKER